MWDGGGAHAVREKGVPGSSQLGRGFISPAPVTGLPRTWGTVHSTYTCERKAGRERGRAKDRREEEKEEKEVPGGHCFAHNSHKGSHGGGENPVILYIHMFTVHSYIIMEYLP